MILTQAEVNDPAIRSVELNLKQALQVRELVVDEMIESTFYESSYHNGGSPTPCDTEQDAKRIKYRLTQVEVLLEIQVKIARAFPELAERG